MENIKILENLYCITARNTSLHYFLLSDLQKGGWKGPPFGEYFKMEHCMGRKKRGSLFTPPPKRMF